MLVACARVVIKECTGLYDDPNVREGRNGPGEVPRPGTVARMGRREVAHRARIVGCSQ